MADIEWALIGYAIFGNGIKYVYYVNIGEQGTKGTSNVSIALTADGKNAYICTNQAIGANLPAPVKYDAYLADGSFSGTMYYYTNKSGNLNNYTNLIEGGIGGFDYSTVYYMMLPSVGNGITLQTEESGLATFNGNYSEGERLLQAINYVGFGNSPSKQIDLMLQYSDLNPSVDWRVYCYNPKKQYLFETTYDLTINWNFDVNNVMKDYFEVEEVVIALIPNPGSSSLLDSITYNLNYLPNTFSIPKGIAYPSLLKVYYYNLNLYVKYKKISDGTIAQTDRFSIQLNFLSNSVSDFEHATTRIDNNDKSTITFIMSTPEEDENYKIITADSDDSDNPSIIDSNLIVSNVGCGANMYAMTKNNFSALVRWLWSSTFIDNIKLINNSPIENIISAQLFPFSISNLSDTTITLGNVDTPIQGEILPSSFNNFHRQLVSSYRVESFYNNFLDFSPYTSISIYLPYIGIKPLDANMINGKTLDVYYTFDLSSGACVASIYVDGNVLYMFEGQIGVNLPLSASNRAQVDATYVAIGASAVMSIASAWIGAGSNIASATYKAEQATKNIDKAWDTAEMVAKTSRTSASVATGKTVLGSLIDSANVQFHTYTQGTYSPNTYGLLPKDVFMIYNRPTYQDIDTFRHVEGRHCMLSRKIGGLHGYTEVHSSIDLSSIPCDEELKARLKEILVGGFIA